MSTEYRPFDRSLHELLVVDDDPASRYATSRLLRGAGFRTREVATGAEGLLAADDRISAIVLDVHLPDIDGFELCRLLRTRPATSHLPVLHLTAAYITDHDKVRGLDSGADAYLTHPVEPAVLVATVQALVRTHVAEEVCRRSEAKFRAIYARAPAGLCLLDDSGKFIDANPAMLGLLGRDLQSVVGHRVSEFVPKEWVERVDGCTRHGALVEGLQEFPLQDAAGKRVPVEWTIFPHIEPNASMGVATDISPRLLLQRERQQLLDRERIARSAAERMSRMKDELIAVLSHELRTPLNAIMGWTHVLQKWGGTPETIRGLDAIERNAHVQARIISDILDMSRLNLGKLRLALEMVDPAELIAEAISSMRPSIDENKQELVVDVQPPYRHIRADSSRLQQIIWNLLSNAIKFSPRGGQIRVRLQEEGQGVRLSVADQGKGIAPEFLPFLFDRFTQSNASSNRRQGGLGLGLSIVKHLVEAHGGTVSAASQGEGRGAVFEVWLPVDGVSISAASSDGSALDTDQERDEAELSLEGLDLLIVDDDLEACDMLQIILRDRGAKVEAVHDYESALKVMDTLAPHVLISDVGMPGRDGYELVREIRRREASTRRHVPAIALTAFTSNQDEQQALDAGFDAHCPKPLRPAQLFQQIRRLAGKPASRTST